MKNKIFYYGTIFSIEGNILRIRGLNGHSKLGDLIEFSNHSGIIQGEIISFTSSEAIILPYGNIEGCQTGAQVKLLNKKQYIYPSKHWVGRIINGLGKAMDNQGELIQGSLPYKIKNLAPESYKRQFINQRVDLKIKSLNTFTTTCLGQRMGIFAPPGVGKSMLIAQLSKNDEFDVVILALIGERGKEVQDFIKKHINLKKTIVVAATSDVSPLLRKNAANVAMAIAEYFRDQRKNVLLLLDSITRFALAQREIGLSMKEPSLAKGYTPSVFTELPKLLERAGTGTTQDSSITMFCTILIEDNDYDEPIANTIRSITDGHIILDRKIAEKGRFPAINILKSLSRTQEFCNSKEENHSIKIIRKATSQYEEMEDLITLGIYKKGTNADLDQSIKIKEKTEKFLHQNIDDVSNLEQDFQTLKNIIHETK